MKKTALFFLLGAVIGFSGCVTTQKVPGSTKGDNKIVVKTEQSFEEAYKQAGQILSTNGYGIDNSDKDLGTIASGPQKLSQLNGSMKVNVSIREDEGIKVIFSGLVKMDADINVGYGVTSKSSWNKVVNKGMSGSIMQVAWNDLFDLAEEYPEGEISFR